MKGASVDASVVEGEEAHCNACAGCPVNSQSLTQADDGVRAVADGLPEGQGPGVGIQHLQVDLGAAACLELGFGVQHQCLPEPAAPMRGVHAQRVDPTSVAVVPGHGGSCNLIVQLRQPEQSVAECQFAQDVGAGIALRMAGIFVLRKDVLPQCNDRIEVVMGDPSNTQELSLRVYHFSTVLAAGR